MKKSQLKEAIKNEIKSILSEDRNPKIYEISSTEANAQLMEIVEHQKQILNILKELKKGDAVFAIKGADLNAAIKLITNEVGKTLTKVKNLEQIKGLQTTFADIREDRNKQLVGLELVQFLMDRFNMSEDEALKSLADNIGNVKHEDDLKEGTWSSGTYNEIGRFIQDVKNLKDKYYNIVGNDDVFDGLDRAEESAREMMINAPENRSDLNEDEMSDEEKDKAASKGAKKKDSVATISNKLQKLTAKMKKKAKEFKEAEGKAKDKIKDELKAMTSEKKELEKNL